MARRTKFRIVVDARTETMSNAALACRHMNHPWDRQPLPPSRRLELARLGQSESTWECLRCGSRKVERFELPSFATLASHIEYSNDYLIAAKGTGRLPRLEAKKAYYVREMPELVAA